MTRDDIIRMARSAGDVACDCCLPEPEPYEMQQFLERFAALVAAAEREAVKEEFWCCIHSDLENGVKSLNQAAWERFSKNHPALHGFAGWLDKRGET